MLSFWLEQIFMWFENFLFISTDYAQNLLAIFVLETQNSSGEHLFRIIWCFLWMFLAWLMIDGLFQVKYFLTANDWKRENDIFEA